MSARILEPDAALVVPGEQVAHHHAADGLVGLYPDEAGDCRGARHPLFGQQALHLPAGRPVALSGDLVPDRHLTLAVGGDGECLQHFEVDLVGPVGVQQLRRGVAEAQALFDDALGRTEARRDPSIAGRELNATLAGASSPRPVRRQELPGCGARLRSMSRAESWPQGSPTQTDAGDPRNRRKGPP